MRPVTAVTGRTEEYKPIRAAHCGNADGGFGMFQEVEDLAEMRTRCPPALRQKIRDAAEESVRSMSAEIAYRLQKSFERDETVRTTLPTLRA
jgi:Arc-like DNA binding domain